MRRRGRRRGDREGREMIAHRSHRAADDRRAPGRASSVRFARVRRATRRVCRRRRKRREGIFGAFPEPFSDDVGPDETHPRASHRRARVRTSAPSSMLALDAPRADIEHETRLHPAAETSCTLQLVQGVEAGLSRRQGVRAQGAENRGGAAFERLARFFSWCVPPDYSLNAPPNKARSAALSTLLGGEWRQELVLLISTR